MSVMSTIFLGRWTRLEGNFTISIELAYPSHLAGTAAPVDSGAWRLNQNAFRNQRALAAGCASVPSDLSEFENLCE